MRFFSGKAGLVKTRYNNKKEQICKIEAKEARVTNQNMAEQQQIGSDSLQVKQELLHLLCMTSNGDSTSDLT